MKREAVDIFYVDSRHEAIHARLVNWANWVRVRPFYGMSAMFKALGYRSNWRQWHEPEARTEVDVNDAWLIEKAVCGLPYRFRFALAWWYVFKQPSVRVVRQKLGVTDDGLLQLCNTARDMTCNRVRSSDRIARV